MIDSATGSTHGRYILAYTCCILVAAAPLSLLDAGDSKLPTPEDVKVQQTKYQTEHAALIKNSGAKLFQPGFVEKAELFAKRAEEAMKEGRLLQAKQGFVQARWQLPYLGPTVPSNVSRVLGTLRMRHSGATNQLAYSPDGKYLATGSDDRSVKIWDLDSGHELRQFLGHGDAVRTLAYSHDGKLIASAGGDDYIKLWNPADGKVLHTLKSQGGYVNVVAFSPDSKHVVSGWSNNVIRIFETATGNLVRTISDFKNQVEWLAFSPDARLIGVVDGGGQVQLYQYPAVVQNPNQPYFWAHSEPEGASYHIAFAPDGKSFARTYLSGIKIYETADPLKPVRPDMVIRTIPPPSAANEPPYVPGTLQCSLFSKDGKVLFTGGKDGVIRLYSTADAKLIGTLKGHNGQVTSLAWNHDTTELASAGADHTVRLWPFDIVAQSREFAGHKEEVWMATLSPDGGRIVSAGNDRNLKVWNAGTSHVLHTLEGHTAPVTVALFSPDGSTILSAAGDRTLKLWNVASGKLINTLKGHEGTITAADFSLDGKKIVSGGVDKLIKVWSVEGGKEELSFAIPSTPSALAFHPDGKQIAGGHLDQHVRLFDVASGKVNQAWLAHGQAVTGLAFGKNGQLLATCGADALVKVWSMADPGKNPSVFAGHTGALSTVAFRPDGKLLASGGSDGVVKLWKVDGAGKDAPQDFRGHKDWVTSVAFHKDGHFFVSASIDKTVRLWELTSKELPLLSEHTGAVKAVAVSPDGTLLASAATDWTIKIWDAKSGVEKATFRFDGYIHAIALAFAPDNKTLFASATDRNIHQWDVSTGAKKALPGHLTGFKIAPPLLRITPDGKKLVVWVPDGIITTYVKVYDLPDGALMMEGVDQGRNVLSAAFAADAKTIALGAADGGVRIYLVDGNRMEIQPGGDRFGFKPQQFVNIKAACAALSNDGKTLAYGSEKGDLHIGDVAKQMIVHTLKGHATKIRACVFSPDGSRLATSGDDNVIKLWDAKTGKELREWDINVPQQIDSNFTPQLTFTPDGKHLITANANTTLYVLELP